MAEQTIRQRPAQRESKPPGKQAAGPKSEALAQLAAVLNAAPPVQRLEAPKRKLAQRAANRTGLPDHVKSGVEALSGLSMDHVRVHYNSPRPAQLNAHAFAQGSDIHVAPGQQRHVPHEAWHVVQQAQGRVRATTQLKGGVALNDDKALESEADRVGRMVAQPMPRARSEGAAGPPRVPASPVGQRQVVQAVRSVATFQAQTPARFGRPRTTIVAIDQALATYNDAGATKHADGLALDQAIGNYVGTPGRMPARVAVANQLRQDVLAEMPLVAALGANAGLTDELIRRAGGGAGAIAQLTPLATAITPAEAGVLPQLVTLSIPHLGTLDLLIQHIQPANAHMLAGLIPAAGGHAHLVQLDNIVQHATPAHALELYTLIPAGIGAGLPALDALIVAAGVANVPALRGMIVGAGGAGSIAHLIAAINLHHAGQGQHAIPLTTHTAGNAVEFQRLEALLPNFARAMPGGVPGGIQPALNAYNAVGWTAPGVVRIPLQRRIQRVEWAHFLQRHTMHYFDFNVIIAQNDQWDFVGAGADAQVEQLVIGALNALAAGNAVANWWLAPQVPRQVPTGVGGYTAMMGTKAGDTQLARPVGFAGVPVDSTILGQFYPVAIGGGVHVLDGAAMRAIAHLV